MAVRRAHHRDLDAVFSQPGDAPCPLSFPDGQWAVSERMGSPRRSGPGYFLVTEIPGPSWDRSRPRREQDGWDEHAAFVDGLTERDVIVLGGPVGDPDFGPALLVFAAENEDEVRMRLSEDPWLDTVLQVESVRRWSIWIGSLAR